MCALTLELGAVQASKIMKQARASAHIENTFDTSLAGTNFSPTTGALLTRDTLSLLSLSRNGLQTTELLHMLAPLRVQALPGAVWARYCVCAWLFTCRQVVPTPFVLSCACARGWV